MHTQRIYEHHESESQLSCINSELLYMESATQLSTSPLFSSYTNDAYVTIHNEGVYIPFPSCTLKLSNLHIQFYLLALTTINDLLPTKDESKSLKVHLHYTSALLLNDFI
jgi:hypothetical protein